MRQSLTILAIGFVLGATLGFGGLWTQVVQPAKAELQELESEHGVMKSALDAAEKTLEEAAKNLREEVTLPTPMEAKTILGSGPTAPSGLIGSATPTRTERTTRVAASLDEMANNLRTTRQKLRQR